MFPYIKNNCGRFVIKPNCRLQYICSVLPEGLLDSAIEKSRLLNWEMIPQMKVAQHVHTRKIKI